MFFARQSPERPVALIGAAGRKHFRLWPEDAAPCASPAQAGHTPNNGKSTSLVSGRPDTTLWSSSGCVAARIESLSPSAAARLQAACIKASVSSSIAVSSWAPKLANNLKAGISKTAPVNPGHFLMLFTNLRTLSRYSDPTSSLPQVSSVSFTVRSNLVIALSRSSNFSFSFVSSCWARRTFSIRSDRSWLRGGISVALSSATASSQVVSKHVAPVSSTRSSMIKKLFRHCPSNALRSNSHCSGPKVTTLSNFLSDSAASTDSWAAMVVGACVGGVFGSWSRSSCRAANLMVPDLAVHACRARDEAINRRVAKVADVDPCANPNNSSCLEDPPLCVALLTKF
mmetsp:Transcript_14208/g.31566  ORF Transcript_14208/g.31566 Transcript_14208/m.31566 type:complete len:342 (+) Transcript_14208:112-1137(+)